MIYNTEHANATAQRIAQSDYSASVKAVCLAALEAVGRLKWRGAVHNFNLLLPGNQIATGNIGCVCYQAPIVMAVLGKQLSIARANQWVGLGNEAALMNFLYTQRQGNIRTWFPGLNIPAGAMVFHGRPDNLWAHVTLGIGNAEVVSCWAGQYAGSSIGDARGLKSDEYKAFERESQELSAKKLSPDTLILPLMSFTSVERYKANMAFINYTTKPFWELW